MWRMEEAKGTRNKKKYEMCGWENEMQFIDAYT